MHIPLSQVSVCVHRLPSLQTAPLGFAGLVHVPVALLHCPATWHWSCAVHTTGWKPTQTPTSHMSLVVHRLPSVHGEPSALSGFEHTPVDGLQVPGAWH